MHKVAIIGLNDFSIKLAEQIKSYLEVFNLSGFDFNFNSFRKAIETGFFSNTRFDSIIEVVSGADIIIINSEINHYNLIFKDIIPFINKDTVITNLNHFKDAKIDIENINIKPKRDAIIESVILNNLDKKINKKVLITSQVFTKLDLVRKLSIFWKSIGFDTEVCQTNDANIILASTLQIPYVLSRLFNFVSSGNKLFIFDKSYTLYEEGIFLNRKNIIFLLQKFIDSLEKVYTMNKEEKQIFYENALEKSNEINNIYNIKINKKEILSSIQSTNKGINQYIRFMLESIFINDILSVDDVLYLNLDSLNLTMNMNKDMCNIKMEQKHLKEFEETFYFCKKKLNSFLNTLSSENVSMAFIKDYLCNE